MELELLHYIYTVSHSRVTRMSSLSFAMYKMKVDGTSFAKLKAVIYESRAIDYLLRLPHPCEANTDLLLTKKNLITLFLSLFTFIFYYFISKNI